MSSNGEQSSKYLNTALKYQDLAMTKFRTGVYSVTESNYEAVVASSLITMVLSMAIPQCDRSSMVQSMVFHFDLLKSIRPIVRGSLELFRTSQIFTNTKPPEEVPLPTLDPATTAALSRLSTVNDEQNDPIHKESREAKLQAISHHAICRKANFPPGGMLCSLCRASTPRIQPRLAELGRS